MATETPAQFEGTLKLATYPNRYSTVIPPEGPFYRTGLVITDLNDVPLIEGLDYYLGYYYKEAAEVYQGAVFGGIMLLNHDAIKYSIYAVGRDYRVPQSEIGKWLVSQDIKDPRNVDWSELMRYAPTIPAIDPPQDLEEAIARDDIVAALNDIRLGIIARASDMDEAYSEVTELIYDTGKKIFEDEMYQHHLLMSQGHSYTAADIGALEVTAKAVDATKAFGRTIDQLVTLMSTSGIQQRHIDALMRTDTTFNNVFGRLRVLNNDILTYTTANSDHVITFKGPNILISTKKAMTFTADSGNTKPGLAVEMSAGLNTLMVHSGPDALAPVFNGVYLITPDMVELYLHEVTLKPANGYMSSTETVKVYGSGKSYAPFRLEANLPEADVGVRGLVKVTSNRTTVTGGYAISQAAINVMKGLLDNYVDDDFAVNGKGFDADQALVLSAADVGVDKMNNTAPADKPVTTALSAALANKALSNHTHTIADVTDVPYASSSAAGLVLLWNIIDQSTDRVVTSEQGFSLEATLSDLEEKANGLIPTWAVLGAAYGNLSFLPIPTSGNYTGFAQLIGNEAAAIVREENGKVYVLRNATDGYSGSEKVLYWTADIVAGQMANPAPTTSRYTPVGLTTLAPGVTLSKILVVGDDGAVFVGSDGAFYLVLFDGTINMSKHTRVSRITTAALQSTVAQNPLNPNEDRVVVTADDVLIVRTVLNNDDFYAACWSAPLTDIGKKSDVVFSSIALTGKYPEGDLGRFVTQGSGSTDSATTNLWYATPEALTKWTSPQVVAYNRRTIMAAADENLIRVRCHPRGRPTGPTGYILGPGWTVSYVIDLDAKTVTLDDDYFPLLLGVNGVEFPKGEYKATGLSVAYGAAFISAFLNADGVSYWCGGSETEDILYRGKNSSAYANTFEALRWNNVLPDSFQQLPVLGPYGTVYGFRMRGLVHLGGTWKQVALRQRGSAVCIQSAYDPDDTYDVAGYGGWGPSNNRNAISQSVYEGVCQLGYVWDGTQCYLNGASFNAAGSKPFKNVAGSTTLTTDRLTVSAQQWTDYENFLNSNISRWADVATENRVYWLSFFDLGGVNLCLAQTTFMYKQADGSYRCYTYFYRIPITYVNGTLTIVFNNGVLAASEEGYNISALTVGAADSNLNQMRLIKCADGWVLRTRVLVRYNTSGTAQNVAYTLRCNASWASWQRARYSYYVGSGDSDLIHMPETNEIVVGGYVSGGVYVGGKAYPGNTIGFDSAASRDVILTGPQVEQGAILYITQSQRFFIGSAEYTLPQYSIDLAAAYPDWQNRTYYFYAETYRNSSNVLDARYTVSTTKDADTATRLYIGYAKTNTVGVAETDIVAVKRLGDVRQLTEHEGTVYRHDSNPVQELKESPLGLLKPLPFGTTGDTYVSQAALSLQATKLVTRPLINRYVPASQPWYGGASQAELFWRKARATPVTAAMNPDANTMGMIWIDIAANSMAGDDSFGTKFKVTTSGGTLRLKLAADDYIHIYIDGVRVLTGASPGYTTVTTYDYPVSNGQHTVAIQCGQAPAAGGTPAWVAFIAYDYNGSTERELTRSSDTSLVEWIATAAGPTSGVLETISHIYTPVANTTAVIVVVAPEIPYAPPFLTRANGASQEVVIASRFYGPDGKMVTLTEITVNLMLIPSSDLSS
jgi:hypothetical protein